MIPHTVIIALLIFFSPMESAHSAPAGVSHEDIRDAILSLVTIFRDNSDKLERHEYRERQLGEQLKKALAGLDKRYRNQDNAILQMSERIKNLESSLVKRDDGLKFEIRKIDDSVKNIQGTLDKFRGELEDSTKGSAAAYTVKDVPTDNVQSNKLDQLFSALESNRQLNEEALHFLKPLGDEISSLRGYFKTGLEKSEANINELAFLTGGLAKDMRRLPSKQDIFEVVNGTVDNLQEIREDLLASSNQGIALIASKIEDKTSALVSELEDIMKTTTEVQSTMETLNAGASKSYEQLLSEVRGLSKVEQVMIQTADNVMDTKRRIEYGVHQILLEVGDLVKVQGKMLNGTVNRRFDDIESTILDNQTGALGNLSEKIETEISQVWRQIGIMYQQLTASATALDRLQQQTDAYVNGSVKTMDSMEGKVGMITSRMTEVDENLNFLLGKLSMVTSEYNQIKSGLAGALDDIRNSFLEVQGNLKDLGPGPRPISEDKMLGNDVPSE